MLHSAFPRTAQYSTEAGKCFTALIVQKWCVHRCERKIGVELGKIEVGLGRFGVNLHKYYSPSLLPNSVHSLLVHFKLCTLHLFLSQQCTPSSLPMYALPLVSWNGWRERVAKIWSHMESSSEKDQAQPIDSRYK